LSSLALVESDGKEDAASQLWDSLIELAHCQRALYSEGNSDHKAGALVELAKVLSSTDSKLSKKLQYVVRTSFLMRKSHLTRQRVEHALKRTKAALETPTGSVVQDTMRLDILEKISMYARYAC